MAIPTFPALFPTTLGYSFGIPTKETGFTLETYEQTDTTDEYQQKDENGQVIELVLHNPRSEIVMHGQTTAALAAMLGTKITVANLMSTQVASGGTTICRTVAFTRGRAVNMAARITATYWPLIPGP